MQSVHRRTLALCALLAAPAAAQVQIDAQVQVDADRGVQPCNETTAGASTANPFRIVTGWNDYRQGSPRFGVGLSDDGGRTWSDFLLRPPAQHQSSIEGDPMTAFCNRSGTLWIGAMSFAGNGGIFVSRLDPSSAVPSAPVMARISGGVDKGWMSAGPRPGQPAQTNLYIAYNEGLVRSLDMGATWSAPLNLGGGLGFNPKTGPGGELYIAYWDFNTQMLLRRSFDGGQTVGPPILVAQRLDVWGIDSSRVPGSYRMVSLAGLAVNPLNGHLYYVYPDTTSIEPNGFNVDLYFCRSTDQGATWTSPVVVNTDAALPGDQFFPWIECDEDGRLHMVFHDTRGVAQQDTDNVGFIDTYYSYSDDGGSTWTEVKLTPTPMDSSQAFSGGFFIGDYLGLSSAGRRTLPTYVDTVNANADIWANVVREGPYTDACMGILCPCGNDDPDAGCGNAGFDGSPATGARLRAGGSDLVASDDLVLTVSGLQPGQSGLVFASRTLGSLPFGDGRRCLTGQLFRYPVRSASAGGQLTYGPGEVVAIAGVAFPPGGQVAPGDQWLYQGWYRDPGGPCGTQFNVSNAISVEWR